MKHLAVLATGLCALLLPMNSAAKQLLITPVPLSVEMSADSVRLPDVLTYRAEMPAADLADLEAYLPAYGLSLVPGGSDAWLTVKVSGEGDPESYRLVSAPDGVVIEAPTAAGAFYGLQTLAQLARGAGYLPVLTIDDAPRFPYRGVHIDESRHFLDKEYVKRQLDMLSTYKVNRLHWHLTDGAGWRLQIPAYPRLTEFGAWRPQHRFMDWYWNGRKYCDESTPGAYGGYFTADDIKEVVEYARLRHITVIPEIEMPGHSAEVTAAYPELSCTGEQYGSDEVCIGNEETFKFFETVLDEVIRLFPSHYIHIGGDEAGREHWHQCPRCQQRMADEGLADEAELQSYMISRIERFVNSRGRDIIGWDEILDGGLAPNATVMSWRGEAGGRKAAMMGHDAIMTPESYCYLDHYQDDPETQPEAFGSLVSLSTAYSYDPAPAELGPEITRHIIGVQGNNWAEYIPTPEHGEYMMYPRMIALAEVGWSPQELRDPKSFKTRVNREVRHMQAKGYNPFPMSEQVRTAQTVDRRRGLILLELDSEREPVEIRYTTDGSIPTADSPLYTAPFEVRDSIAVKATIIQDGKPVGRMLDIRTDYHKAIGKKITYADSASYYMYNEVYKAGGDTALVDGLRGGKTYLDGRWQGFCPNDLDCVIDLGEITDVHRVMANFMQFRAPQVFLPEKVEVWVSCDGEHYSLLGTDTVSEEEAEPLAMFRDFGWVGAPVKARYIRFKATQRYRKFLFVDEIVVQ